MNKNDLESSEMVVDKSNIDNMEHSTGSINAVNNVNNAVITQDLCDELKEKNAENITF